MYWNNLILTSQWQLYMYRVLAILDQFDTAACFKYQTKVQVVCQRNLPSTLQFSRFILKLFNLIPNKNKYASNIGLFWSTWFKYKPEQHHKKPHAHYYKIPVWIQAINIGFIRNKSNIPFQSIRLKDQSILFWNIW